MKQKKIFVAGHIADNLQIQNNLILGAQNAGIMDICFLGSSCVYPRDCPQPMKEEHLLTGPLEVTNEPYAIAKIAGIKLCEAMNMQYNMRCVCVMPTNLYGCNDNFDLDSSHVLPALIRKAHEAKLAGQSSYAVWDSGSPRREFLAVEDLADACVFLIERGITHGVYNAGCGEDLSISDLAKLINKIVGFTGDIEFDKSMPDGTPQKLPSAKATIKTLLERNSVKVKKL